MESACVSQCEDGLPAPTGSLQWGAAQVAPIIVGTRCSIERNNSGSAAAASDNDHELDSSSCISHLLLQKLVMQRFAGACTSSLPSASTSGNVKETMQNDSRQRVRPSRDHHTERREALKDEVAASCNSRGIKRSSSTAAAASHDDDDDHGAAENSMVGAGAARVRARPGEATDQHSVAERTRRTKITDRMRALHRLIPDASKTNKASMLDEVIQYVSSLQARLKMECTRKLDVRSEALTTSCPNAPFDTEGWKKSCNRVYVNEMIERVLDPHEDRLAEVERQVMSRLSHPNLNLSHTSMYLASLGLALLPISHLPNSSSTPTTNASHV